MRFDDDELVCEINGHMAGVNSVCLTPDGKHVMSSCSDETICITCFDDGDLVRKIKQAIGALYSDGQECLSDA